MTDARIEITNACNYKCGFCPQSKQTRKIESMSVELFDTILEKVKSYEHITFSGMGEPMIHPEFFHFMGRTIRKGFKVLIITNGSKLDQTMFKELDYKGIEAVRISWYNKPEQKENLDNILKLKTRTTKLNLHYTPLNIDASVDKFIEEYKDKVDMLEVWKPHNWVDVYKFRKVENQINCNRIKRDPLQIQVDGSVVACCTGSWDNELVLGNLKTQSLDEIFESDLHKRLKRHDYKGLICEHCDFRNENKQETLYFSNSGIEDRTNKTSTTFDIL